MNPEEKKEGNNENIGQKVANEEHEEYDIKLLDEEVLEIPQPEVQKPIQYHETPSIQPTNIQTQESFYSNEKFEPQENSHHSNSRQEYSHVDNYMRSESSKKGSMSKYKEEEDEEKAENTKALYRREDDSEIKIHFYIERVYWPRNMSISLFIAEVRRQVCKASAPEIIQVISYEGTEVTLAIGMKTDKDALAIMRGHKTIYLNDRFRKLYLTTPKPSKTFSLLWDYKRKYGGIWDHPRDYMKKENQTRSQFKGKPSIEERSRSSSRSRNKRRQKSFSPNPSHHKARFSPKRFSPARSGRSRGSPPVSKRNYRSRSRSFSKPRDRSNSSYRKPRESKRKPSAHDSDLRYSSHHERSNEMPPIRNIQKLPINVAPINMEVFPVQNPIHLIPRPQISQEQLPQFMCYALGLPLEFGEGDLNEALKSKISAERLQGKLELPSSIDLIKDEEMEYYRLSFPNEGSIDELIFNPIKIKGKYPVMIVPHFEDRTVLNSAVFHEILVTSDQKISAINIFQAFSQYGDIITVLEEKEDTFVVIFAHRKTVKDLKLPQAFSFGISSNTAENGVQRLKITVEMMKSPKAVKRQSIRENYNHYIPQATMPPTYENPAQAFPPKVAAPPVQPKPYDNQEGGNYNAGGNSNRYNSNYRQNGNLPSYPEQNDRYPKQHSNNYRGDRNNHYKPTRREYNNSGGENQEGGYYRRENSYYKGGENSTYPNNNNNSNPRRYNNERDTRDSKGGFRNDRKPQY